MPSKPIKYRADIIFATGALVFFAAFAVPTHAAESVRLWKATPARPYVLRGTDRRLLDRAEQFVKDKQWDDAVAALMRLLESENFSVVAVGERHFVSLTEYCQRLLAKLPAEPLARYCQLVDATAESWYRQGIKNRDSDMLQHVVDKYFCSRWGDDALFALGELALQRGDFQTARNAWLQISPQLGSNVDRLTYPGSDLSLATVRARLVLVSMREGDLERAGRELVELRESFPTAWGRLGDREWVLVEELAGLLKEASLRRAVVGRSWRTFGANSQRTNLPVAPTPEGPCELVWSQPLDNEQLTVFPVIVNDLVIYQDATSVRAVRLADGEQVFRTYSSVFRSPGFSSEWLGQSCYTLTASNHYVFGITTSPLGLRRKPKGAEMQSTLWSLDLHRDGAIALHQSSEEASVAFVGAPVIEGMRVYVPIRSHDQTARAGIACYDLSVGELRWQRWFCQANTPATGWTNEITCNLLTYDSGILYMNTHLGAVAAVRADDGQVLWLRTYERLSTELDSEGNCAYYRGPSPGVYFRGVLVALPTDSESMFAYDASTGEEIWRHEKVKASRKLCGIQDGQVVSSEESLLACHLRTGLMLGELDNPWVGFPFAKQANILSVGEYVVATGKTQLAVYRIQPKTTNRSQNSQTPSRE